MSDYVPPFPPETVSRETLPARLRGLADAVAMDNEYAEAGMLLRAAGLVLLGHDDKALSIIDRAHRAAAGKSRRGVRTRIATARSLVSRLIEAEASK